MVKRHFKYGSAISFKTTSVPAGSFVGHFKNRLRKIDLRNRQMQSYPEDVNIPPAIPQLNYSNDELNSNQLELNDLRKLIETFKVYLAQLETRLLTLEAKQKQELSIKKKTVKKIPLVVLHRGGSELVQLSQKQNLNNESQDKYGRSTRSRDFSNSSMPSLQPFFKKSPNKDSDSSMPQISCYEEEMLLNEIDSIESSSFNSNLCKLPSGSQFNTSSDGKRTMNSKTQEDKNSRLSCSPSRSISPLRQDIEDESSDGEWSGKDVNLFTVPKSSPVRPIYNFKPRSRRKVGSNEQSPRRRSERQSFKRHQPIVLIEDIFRDPEMNSLYGHLRKTSPRKKNLR